MGPTASLRQGCAFLVRRGRARPVRARHRDNCRLHGARAARVRVAFTAALSSAAPPYPIERQDPRPNPRCAGSSAAERPRGHDRGSPARPRSRWASTDRPDGRQRRVRSGIPCGRRLPARRQHRGGWPRDPEASPIYFPGVPEREDAQPIAVAPGSEVDIGDFQLPVAIEKVVVHGTVLTTDGRPLAECVVRMLSEISTSFEHDLQAITDGNGRFQFTGIAGRPYRITVSKEEGDTPCLARARVTAGSGETVTIRAECLTP